ncbi:MAG: hypothetical protein AAFQ07_08105, partial [Chloroflexota bacterium]
VAVPVADASIEFDNPGDTAAVDDIENLTLSPFESSLTEWGVAVLVLQADLPDTLPGQNVTMLLFGDVDLQTSGGAYYFTSGIGSPSCNQAPSGILIQTPEGAGMVNLTINGINISLGSTAFLGTLEEDVLTVALLEGETTLSVANSDDADADEETSVSLVPEEFTTVELDEEGDAIGAFTEPAPTTELELPALPLILLPRDITEDSDSATDSDDGTEGDVSDVPDEAITPQSGEWLIGFGDFVFDTCTVAIPTDQIESSIRTTVGTDTVTINTDDGFVFEDLFLLSELDAAGLAYTFDDSVPNVYTITISVEDVSIVYQWRIVSDSLIEGSVEQNISAPGFECVGSMTFTFEHQG